MDGHRSETREIHAAGIDDARAVVVASIDANSTVENGSAWGTGDACRNAWTGGPSRDDLLPSLEANSAVALGRP